MYTIYNLYGQSSQNGCREDVLWNVESGEKLQVCSYILSVAYFRYNVSKPFATIWCSSSSYNKLVIKIRLVATCHLQTRYNLLKQLAASLWITSFSNQLETSLLTTCNRLVVNMLSQAMWMHSDIGLLALLYQVNTTSRAEKNFKYDRLHKQYKFSF